MITMRTKAPKVLVGCLVLATFAACEMTARQDSTETDAFVQNALDTYGVIDVVPSAPLPAPTAEQACAGRTGIQADLRDPRTGQPLDCGPAPAPTT